MRPVVRSLRAMRTLTVAASSSPAASVRRESRPDSPPVAVAICRRGGLAIVKRGHDTDPSADPADDRVAGPVVLQRRGHVRGVPVGCSLHRTNDAGVEAPGFPIELEGTLIDNSWNDFTIGCGPSREPLVRDGFDDLTFVGLVGPSGQARVPAFHSSGYPSNRWPQPFPAPDGDCHVSGS